MSIEKLEIKESPLNEVIIHLVKNNKNLIPELQLAIANYLDHQIMPTYMVKDEISAEEFAKKYNL